MKGKGENEIGKELDVIDILCDEIRKENGMSLSAINEKRCERREEFWGKMYRARLDDFSETTLLHIIGTKARVEETISELLKRKKF